MWFKQHMASVKQVGVMQYAEMKESGASFNRMVENGVA